ncbi:beta-defensin 119-like [Hipposideros larvatus]
MKFLFLFLAIFLAMEPVVSGSILQCMGNLGTCRTSCKKGEYPYFHCGGRYQSCCLPSYMKINISGREDKK